MVTSKQKLAVAKPRASWLRRHKLLTALILLIVAATVGVQAAHTRKQHAAEAEKVRFAQAEQDVDRISSQIIAAVGQPLKIDKKKFCSRPNLKFDNGQLSCDVETQVTYAATSVLRANEIYHDSRNSIENYWHLISEDYPIGSRNKDSPFIEDNALSKQDSLASKVISDYGSPITNVSCDVSYILQRNMYLTVHCGSRAIIQHYPLSS